MREVEMSRVGIFRPLVLPLSATPPLGRECPAANRKKQSTRVFKINCYDGFCWRRFFTRLFIRCVCVYCTAKRVQNTNNFLNLFA